MNTAFGERMKMAKLVGVDKSARGAAGAPVGQPQGVAFRGSHAALFGSHVGKAETQLDELCRNLLRRPLIQLNVRKSRPGPGARPPSRRRNMTYGSRAFQNLHAEPSP